MLRLPSGWDVPLTQSLDNAMSILWLPANSLEGQCYKSRDGAARILAFSRFPFLGGTLTLTMGATHARGTSTRHSMRTRQTPSRIMVRMVTFHCHDSVPSIAGTRLALVTSSSRGKELVRKMPHSVNSSPGSPSGFFFDAPHNFLL